MTEPMRQATENQASTLEDNLSAYVQGRLDAVTARRIEARAEKNEVFAQKLEFEKRIAGVICGPKTALGADSFEALRARIEAPSIGSRIASFLLPRAPGAQWAVASMLLAVLAGTLFWANPLLKNETSNDFETLSSPNDAVAYAPDRDYARVIFSSEVTAGQRAEVAGELGFNIESDSGPLDSFLVSIPRSDDDVAKMIASWCRDERVTFCQPILQGSRRDSSDDVR